MLRHGLVTEIAEGKQLVSATSVDLSGRSPGDTFCVHAVFELRWLL